MLEVLVALCELKSDEAAPAVAAAQRNYAALRRQSLTFMLRTYLTVKRHAQWETEAGPAMLMVAYW